MRKYVALALSTLSIGCTLEKLCQDLDDIYWEIYYYIQYFLLQESSVAFLPMEYLSFLSLFFKKVSSI